MVKRALSLLMLLLLQQPINEASEAENNKRDDEQESEQLTSRASRVIKDERARDERARILLLAREDCEYIGTEREDYLKKALSDGLLSDEESLSYAKITANYREAINNYERAIDEFTEMLGREKGGEERREIREVRRVMLLSVNEMRTELLKGK